MEKIKLSDEIMFRWKTWMEKNNIGYYKHNIDQFEIKLKNPRAYSDSALPPWVSTVVFAFFIFLLEFKSLLNIAKEDMASMLLIVVGIVTLIALFDSLVIWLYDNHKKKIITVEKKLEKEEYSGGE